MDEKKLDELVKEAIKEVLGQADVIGKIKEWVDYFSENSDTITEQDVSNLEDMATTLRDEIYDRNEVFELDDEEEEE